MSASIDTVTIAHGMTVTIETERSIGEIRHEQRIIFDGIADGVTIDQLKDLSTGVLREMKNASEGVS